MPLNSQCGESRVLVSLQAATCGLLLDYQADPLKDKMLQSYIYFMYVFFFSYLLFGCWKRNFNMTVTGDSQFAQSINCLPLDCKLKTVGRQDYEIGRFPISTCLRRNLQMAESSKPSHLQIQGSFHHHCHDSGVTSWWKAARNWLILWRRPTRCTDFLSRDEYASMRFHYYTQIIHCKYGSLWILMADGPWHYDRLWWIWSHDMIVI